MKEDLFRGTEPRIFSTHPHNPENGRTFIWAWTEWFERLEGDSGAIAFTPVADSEPELRHWLKVNKCEQDLVEMKGAFARDVRDEFLEQTPLYPEVPETSSQELDSGHLPDEDADHL